MRSNRCFISVALFAGLVSLSAPNAGSCGDAEAPRPGQLRGVLATLNRSGDTWTQQGSEWLLKREYIAHLLFMETDPRGGTGGGGWYRPSQGRYGWEWLRERCDKNGDGTITLEEFGGPREWFEALDKDRDGVLTRDDFDWSADSPIVRATARVKPLFEKIDRDASGRITPEEWKLWFDALGGGKGYLSQDDLIPLFLEKAPRGKAPATPPTPVTRTNAPISKARLSVVCSYLSCVVGSLSEGPAVNERAARHFSLRAVDGKSQISLSAAPGPTGQAARADFRQLHLRPLPVPVRGPGKPVPGVQGQGRFPRGLRPRSAPKPMRLDPREQRKGRDPRSFQHKDFTEAVSGRRHVL